MDFEIFKKISAGLLLLFFAYKLLCKIFKDTKKMKGLDKKLKKSEKEALRKMLELNHKINH